MENSYPIRKIIFYICIFLINFILIEIIIFSTLTFCYRNYFSGPEKCILYFPPDISKNDYEYYQKNCDPNLGWFFPSSFGKKIVDIFSCDVTLDSRGARLNTYFPNPDISPSRISIYGDSFSFGSEVDDADAWGNVLSKLISARVANYAVPGYGTDQAYLRFHLNKQESSPIVILGHMSENIVRNLNQYRYLLYPHEFSKFKLKPRFRLNKDKKLELIPPLRFSYEGFCKFLEFPENFLRDDYFIPDGKSGFIKLKFPYSISLLKLLLRNYKIRARIKRVPSYTEFYDWSHESNALPITYNIIKNFHNEAINRGKKPIVIIFPMEKDIIYLKKYNRLPFETLLEKLTEDKIDFIDVATKLQGLIKGRNFNELLAPGCHFNKEGNALIAQIVYRYLKEQKVMSDHPKISDGSTQLPIKPTSRPKGSQPMTQ